LNGDLKDVAVSNGDISTIYKILGGLYIFFVHNPLLKEIVEPTTYPSHESRKRFRPKSTIGFGMMMMMMTICELSGKRGTLTEAWLGPSPDIFF
jgi:hypothetical protein